MEGTAKGAKGRCFATSYDACDGNCRHGGRGMGPFPEGIPGDYLVRTAGVVTEG
jgi:hypothetical protein